MPKAQIAGTVNLNPSLLAFRPRQVVLLCKRPSMKQNDGTNNNKTLILKPEQKALLFHSIAKYLECSGFSKTLKKFRSEAKLEKDDLENSSFDLEEMFCKFLEMGNQVSKNFKSEKVQADIISGRGGEDDRKKKNSDKSTSGKPIGSNNDDEVMMQDSVPIGVKSKDKRKGKKNSSSLEQEEQVSTKALHDPADVAKWKDKKKKCNLNVESLTNNNIHNPSESLCGTTEENTKNVVFVEGKKVTDSVTDNKSKDKKRKKDKLSSDHVDDKEKTNNIDSTKDDLRTPKEHLTDKESKGSKKRKRMASEEDAVQAADAKQLEESKHRRTEESKRRKTEGSKEPKISEQSTELNSASRTEEKGQKEESSQVGFVESQKRSSKQINGQSNGILEENGEKSASQKTIKRQQNGSAEPKTVKYFQRVKVDEVVFSDGRLKDNSYWAKDGAESGYGAKAQEVLGQVRGRDFRHEKTKKKRGTYRGGQIDLHSHSVKFNYSDDE
ncbi:suppressor protein SRP40 isoform X2 [Jatropha curcas]|uniref:suppressor protein SRP40 isoform X2 n=1 Tax=Jatropha curcas TaxID=180498 RepID=UPI0005FA9CF3|nr:suppressor protein SRP40 isoform X2 [Jatropha curcas]